MPFQPGQEVRLRNNPGMRGVIQEIGRSYAGIQYYRVFWNTGESKMVPEIDLAIPLVCQTPSDELVADRLGDYYAFQRLMTLSRLNRDEPLRNNIIAFNASRTRFFPYQFKPLIKFLDSPTRRMLIADEVGLGKTIEAGLILTELEARRQIQRVLIVCPANLRQKWEIELKHRFGQEFIILKAQEFHAFLDRYENSPETVFLKGIISIETIRDQQILQRIDALSPDFDLVVVDEAHHMRNPNNQQRAGFYLSRNADAMLMLTATPVHLGTENLYSLLKVMDDEVFPDRYTAQQRFAENESIVTAQNQAGRLNFDPEKVIALLETAAQSPEVQANPAYSKTVRLLQDLRDFPQENQEDKRRRILSIQKWLAELNLIGHIFTRTKKKEVHEYVPLREARAIHLEFSDRELNLYKKVTDFVRMRSLEQTSNPVVQKWILNTPQRQMASSIGAMVEHYRGAFAGTPEIEDIDDFDPMERHNTANRSTLSKLYNEIRGIVSVWPEDNPDTKYECLVKQILEPLKNSEVPDKVLIFAFFKPTLRYLKRRLQEDGFATVMISGDMDASERPAEIQKFRSNPQIQVLLSSRVGSEGLDFQFCHHVVNYDLPWNPMEVEQRIGRVDRIGQESARIFIYNFWIAGTIEERILRKLYERIHIFERSVGSLEMIIGSEVRELERDLLTRDLTMEEQENRIEQTALVLEKKLIDLDELDNDAAQFIGTDEYFINEVDLIKRNRRHVTGEQLFRFAEDFVKQFCPGTSIVYDTDTRIGTIHPDTDLQRLIAQYHKASELGRYFGRHGIIVTFDSQAAFENYQIEFLNVLHPLIRMMSEHCHSQLSEMARAHFFELVTENVPPGLYFYFVYKIRISGIRKESSLGMVLLNKHGELVSLPDASEELMGEMVERGRATAAVLDGIDEHARRRISHSAEEAILGYIQKIRQEAQDWHSAFLARRRESLRTHFERLIASKEDQLARENIGRRREAYMRMLKGSIARLRAEYAEGQQRLIEQAVFAVDYEEVAAGFLHSTMSQS